MFFRKLEEKEIFEARQCADPEDSFFKKVHSLV